MCLAAQQMAGRQRIIRGGIQVPHLSKQQLLEADLETRLDALISALSDELRLLPPPSDRPIMPGNSWSLN